MFDEVGAVAWEHVDDGNLDHRVAGGLEAHRGAGHVDQYLTDPMILNRPHDPRIEILERERILDRWPRILL
jgi:hypothetical protein